MKKKTESDVETLDSLLAAAEKALASETAAWWAGVEDAAEKLKDAKEAVEKLKDAKEAADNVNNLAKSWSTAWSNLNEAENNIKKMNRKPIGKRASAVLNLRLKPADKKRWANRARLEKKTLSKLIVSEINAKTK